MLSRDEVYGNADDLQLANHTRQGALASGDGYDAHVTGTIPQGTSGSYHVLLRTDANSSVYEYRYESNNVLVGPGISVVAPDLRVSSVEAPQSATIGESLEVTWTVSNGGDGDAKRDWQDRIWLSKDAVLSRDDVSLGTRSRNAEALLPGADYTGHIGVQLPLDASVMPGEYFVLVEADSGQNQPESDDSNNSAASTAVALRAASHPDLAVTDISVPATASANGQINVSWTVANHGDATATGPWTDQVWLTGNGQADALLASSTYTDRLAPGESVTQNVQVQLPGVAVGDYRIAVQTDAGGAIFESEGEANNRTVDDATLAVEAAPRPNLAVSNFVGPVSATTGHQVQLSWVVSNIGEADTPWSQWTDSVWLSSDQVLDPSDLVLGSVTSPSPLAVGGSYIQALTVAVPRGIRGSCYFIVKTDANNVIDESSRKADNEAQSAVVVEASPTQVLDMSPASGTSCTAAARPWV